MIACLLFSLCSCLPWTKRRVHAEWPEQVLFVFSLKKTKIKLVWSVHINYFYFHCVFKNISKTYLVVKVETCSKNTSVLKKDFLVCFSEVISYLYSNPRMTFLWLKHQIQMCKWLKNHLFHWNVGDTIYIFKNLRTVFEF